MNSHLIPSRHGRPKTDPIFGLARLASERRAGGHPVVDATIGVLLDDEGKLALLDTATRALREVSPADAASYAPIAGTPAFLEAVKHDLLGGFPALAARATAVATPGGTGALRHAIASLLEEKQAMLTTSLYWAPYATLAEENGRSLRTFRMFDGAGRFDVPSLEAEVGRLLGEQGRVALVLNDPCHNPSGYSMSDDDWRRTADVLVAASEKGPVSLVLDLAYAVFSDAGFARPLSVLGPISDRVLTAFCWSASKTFLQYGQRVGALVAVATDEAERDELGAALSYASRGTWSNCNHGGLEAITRLLSDPELRASADAERRGILELLARRVAEWNRLAPGLGLRYPPYAGGFFVTVSCDDPPGAAAALRKHDIFVVPVSGALRVALCSVPLRDVERLARTMAEVLVTAPAPAVQAGASALAAPTLSGLSAPEWAASRAPRAGSSRCRARRRGCGGAGFRTARGQSATFLAAGGVSRKPNRNCAAGSDRA
ncbi:MAG: aminotransferase class I/II-fold pyridoxal phosphate-dependent enzyme [Polyangiaceae bacterium]|nr:aminotransferase class I/II-fold pyridoxal phosphate-dependent enzyme [Polyangiaceae bacterium]